MASHQVHHFHDALYCVRQRVHRLSQLGLVGSVWIAFQRKNPDIYIEELSPRKKSASRPTKASCGLYSLTYCHRESSLCIAERLLKLIPGTALHMNCDGTKGG